MVLAFSIQGIDWRAHVGGFIAGLFAGFAAEGVGSASTRQDSSWSWASPACSSVAVGLVAWRTAQVARRVPVLVFQSAHFFAGSAMP